ncbi:MAG: hypothetical protein PHE51_06480 [Eubacteriales bacterium]|nr:hypothetical protein [Eubacteriales bacterium]
MKLITKTLIVLMLFTAVISAGYIVSADGFMMRIDTVTIPQGYDGEVKVPVYLDSIPDNAQLSCFSYKFYFDSSNLSFITSKDPSSFTADVVADPNDCLIGKVERNDGTNGRFFFGFVTTQNHISKTGLVMYLPFYVNGSLAPGRYNIIADPDSNVSFKGSEDIPIDDLFLNINSYLQFGAIVVEGQGEYNDYEEVSSRAQFPTYTVTESSTASGTVTDVDGVATNPNTQNNPDTNTNTDTSDNNNTDYNPPTSHGGSGTLASSDYEPQKNDYVYEVKTVADTFDAGTMVLYNDTYVAFNTIKTQAGYVVCSLYKDNRLVGNSITKSDANQKVTSNVAFSDIPDIAVTYVIKTDGTIDCYGKYAVRID